MRGVSILVVLILHFHLAYNLVQSPFARIFGADFVSAVSRNGNYGVTIFFVISGYLITSMSMRFGSLATISARRFYVFRFAANHSMSCPGSDGHHYAWSARSSALQK